MSKRGTGSINLRGAVAIDANKGGVTTRMQIRNGKLYAEGVDGGIDANAGIKNLMNKGYSVKTITKNTLEIEKRIRSEAEKSKQEFDAQGGGKVGGKLRRTKRISDRQWKNRGR